MEYRQTIDRIALSVLNRSPDIPDYHLMVGTAEELAPLPVLIPQHEVPKEVAQSLTKLNDLDNDTVAKLVDEQSLEINDFNGNTALLAGMIGGAV